MMLYDAGLHAEEAAPSMNLIKQKNMKEGTTPAKNVVALHSMHDIPKSHFLFIFSDKTPAQTPRTEYDELNTNDETSPKYVYICG